MWTENWQVPMLPDEWDDEIENINQFGSLACELSLIFINCVIFRWKNSFPLPGACCLGLTVWMLLITLYDHMVWCDYNLKKKVEIFFWATIWEFWWLRLKGHVHSSFMVIGYPIHQVSVNEYFPLYGIHIILFIDWLKVRHVIKNKLTILKKPGQSRK